VLLGDGNGSFASQTPFAVGSYPNSVVVSDFNGDKKLDLAVQISTAGTPDKSISVLLNTTDFPIPAEGTPLATTDFPIPAEGTMGKALPPINFTVDRGVVLRAGKQGGLLTGMRRKDRLLGGNGKDKLFGNQGDDRLTAGKGRDKLNGMIGNDVLVGGLGGDMITGGLGRDTIVYQSTSDGRDTITDFMPRQDLLDLRSIFSQSAFQVVGVSDFQRWQQLVKLVQVGPHTQVQIDTDGAGVGTIFTPLATLQNVASSAVSSRNFVVR
jgi:Ca2+-binding RTX toxin-like protein